MALRAGALIAALGGLCAEEVVAMSATKTCSADRFMERKDKRKWLASASAEELVQTIYNLVREVDDGDVSNALYFALGEAFERFAPEAEWVETERRILASPSRGLTVDAILRGERSKAKRQAKLDWLTNVKRSDT